jgi:hypothetical protein
MTDIEFNSIVNEVVNTLKVNSKTIDQLTAKLDLHPDTDWFELNDGRKVSFGVLRALIVASASDAASGLQNFLSRVVDDTAQGHITFRQGLTSKSVAALERGATFGTFNSGVFGTGACIDGLGAAEVQSLFSRDFISTPEFRFNRVLVTEGEWWNTNGFGDIVEVDYVNQIVTLKIEEGEFASVKEGDLCRGIYNMIGYNDENPSRTRNYSVPETAADTNGFPGKAGFFTSYFWVKKLLTPYTSGKCRFEYETMSQQVNDTDTTPHPCAHMKFAQYGNFTDVTRQSSMIMNSIGGHSYTQQMEGVNTWALRPSNIASRLGYLDNLTVVLKRADGTTYERTLEGNGLFVKDNVYFGNALVHLDLETLEDIADMLGVYHAYLSAYTDVIKVDDAGNVIDGLWYTETIGNQTVNRYRIYTALTVRKGNTLLTEAPAGQAVGSGTYKVTCIPHGCTCSFSNSTLYITGIENVKDGVAGSPDDVNFDYDAMRAVERVSVELVIDCEGVGTIVQNVPITIKHDPVPYIIADLTNENAAISWNTDDAEYIGLPVVTKINMSKGNEDLPIEDFDINTINGVQPVWQQNIGRRNAGRKRTTTGWEFTMDLETGIFSVIDAPFNAAAVTEIIFTVSTTYAGVSYERTLSLHITRSADRAIWDIIPTHDGVNVDKNDHFNFSSVGVRVYSQSAEQGRQQASTLPTGWALKYAITKVTSEVVNGETVYSTVTMSEVTMTTLNDTVNLEDSQWRDNITNVTFTLYNADGDIEDSEGVSIVREGVGGQGSTGPAGNGVSGITNYYRRSTLSTGVTRTGTYTAAEMESDWSTAYVAPNEEWPFVWTYTKYTFTKADPYYTPCELISRYTEDGVGITSITHWYLNTSSGTGVTRPSNPSQAGWSTTFTPPTNSLKYVWRFIDYEYSDGTHAYSPCELVSIFVKDGQSSFKSIVFKRYTPTTQKPKPDKPTTSDGTFGSPVPTGWSDGIPSGTEPLWMTSRIFTSDGQAPAQNTWSDVVLMSDTDSFDVEFSKNAVGSYPAEPSATNTHGGSGTQIWFDPKLDATEFANHYDEFNWMATRSKSVNSSGVPEWSPWVIVLIKGEPGVPGVGVQHAYTVVASGTTPTIITRTGNLPVSASPITWYASTTNLVVGSNQAMWMSERPYENGEYGDWGDPVRISGADGQPGADGRDIEFIYKRSNDMPNLNGADDRPTVNNKNLDGYVPSGDGVNSGWSGSPAGVDEDHKYEWMCQRIKAVGATQWGDWSNVFVWSAYGDTGMDGDGIEYVFKRTTGSTRPTTPSNSSGSTNSQGEWIPSGWTDNPSGVSKTYPNEWVSVRKKINGSWGSFSTPAKWATYSETPTVEIKGNPPTWWINGVDTGVKAEGEDGTGIALKGSKQVLYTTSGKTALQDIDPEDCALGDCWVVDANRHLYVFVGGDVSFPDYWNDMGEFKGADGADGSDGDNAYVHLAWANGITFENDGFTPRSYDTFSLVKGETEYDWMGICTDNSPNDPGENRWTEYEWNYIKGKDGDFYERVYLLTQKNITPVMTNASSQNDNFYPTVSNRTGAYGCYPMTNTFTDNPNGVREAYPFEWMSERKKSDGVWDSFSTPVLWANWSDDGEPGPPGVSVTGTETWYLKTTLSVGVTVNTPGWSQTYEAPDADRPYVWRYTINTLSNGTTTPANPTCELIAVYSSSPNVNLLDDTSFTNDDAMEAWLRSDGRISKVQNDPTADPYDEENYDDELFDNFFGITTGTQSRNAYMGRFKGTAAQSSLAYLLQQVVHKTGQTEKLEGGRWYTFSFWVKGNSQVHTSINFVDETSGQKMYVDGVQRDANHYWQWKNLTNTWTRHTLTFKAIDTLVENASYYVQWLMTDTTTEQYVYVCMPKLEIGMVATAYTDGTASTKAVPRFLPWKAGEMVYAGDPGERFIDLRLYGGTWYQCRKAHFTGDGSTVNGAATVDNRPGTNAGRLLWRQASQFDFIATKLLLAEEAAIDNLVAKLIRTGALGEPHVEMFGSVARFFGTLEIPSIELATDDDGVGVFRFYNKYGSAMYDLGPKGILNNFDQTDESNTLLKYKKVTEISQMFGVTDANCTNYYCFHEGYKRLKDQQGVYYVQYDIGNSGDTSQPSQWNGKYFKRSVSKSNLPTTSDYIPNGIYVEPNNGIYPASMEHDIVDLYYVVAYKFSSGSLVQQKHVYFKMTTGSNPTPIATICRHDGVEYDGTLAEYMNDQNV